MKYFKSISVASILFCLISCGRTFEKKEVSGSVKIDTADVTNNFYDNSEVYSLPVNKLTIDGEISNPGISDFSDLPKHTVIVKETLTGETGIDGFIGAYRYDGYSLFDILNNSQINKANSKEFNPIIDLYVEIENEKGDKVVFSWGEIFYPSVLHKIIIATEVSRIVPSKTKDLWPLPTESRIVAAGDLLTERNISSPSKITVRSYPGSFKVEKGMTPMYSEDITINLPSGSPVKYSDKEEMFNKQTYNTVFYGRGAGIHSTKPFTGSYLKDILLQYYPVSKQNIQKGMLCIAGLDGYRIALSYSELFNRNDQQEFLLTKYEKGNDGGLYRLFPSPDFFSDRAIKSVTEISILN